MSDTILEIDIDYIIEDLEFIESDDEILDPTYYPSSSEESSETESESETDTSSIKE